jgi:ribosomal protein S21
MIGVLMEVHLREGESQESLLKRFQLSVMKSGVLRDAKSHRFFVSKGVAERIKSKNAARKRQRNLKNKY